MTGKVASFEHIQGESMSELTAAHSTLEKAREVTNCPDGVDLQVHLKQLVAENLVMQQAIDQHRCGFIVCPACNLEISSATDDVCYALSEAPATDSILREAEVRGVENFANTLHVVGPHEHPFSVLAREFAKQLREGKAE